MEALGVIALRSLILADPSMPLEEVMRTEFQRAVRTSPRETSRKELLNITCWRFLLSMSLAIYSASSP